jgi:cell division septation protein DedD
MNIEDKEDLDEDSFFGDDYDEEAVDYDLNEYEDEDEDEYLEKDIFEPDLTKRWDDADLEEELPFDDELEFEEEDLGADLELEDKDSFDPAPDLDFEGEPYQEFDHDDEWQDDELDSQEEKYSQPWPLGLFAVGIIALLLLAAGGYGVLEQRLETQKEVRLLRAKLATTTSNTEIAESRQAQRNLQIHNEELRAQEKILQAEIAALYEELNQKTNEAPIQSSEAVSPAPAPEIVKPAPEIVEPSPEIVKPTPVQQAPTETVPPETPLAQNTWFVNFASYRNKATADNWASRLSVEAGRVTVVSGEKKGTLFYRVRVLDLPSKEIAEKIARQLEQTHHLSPRWVGKQQ